MTAVGPLKDTITIDLTPGEAFELFTAGFTSWWPAEFSWSGPDLLHTTGMDGRLDGMLSEIGPHGFRIDWGRVTSWDPPASLSFSWQISAERVPIPDPERASTVTVTFSHAGEGTRVDVTHDAWEHHGSGAQAYRDDFADAWPMVLDRYRRAAEGPSSASTAP